MASKLKYVPSKVKSNSPTCYEPYLDCTNRPTFSVEVAYCYTVKSPATDFFVGTGLLVLPFCLYFCCCGNVMITINK